MNGFNTYHAILISICLLSVVSCESVIDIDDSDFQSQLVINSYFAPDSVWQVQLTRTKSVFDSNTDLGIRDAKVLIQDLTSNIEFNLQHTQDGIYHTSSKPQEGHVYHILVDDEELGVSQAIGKVPSTDHIEVIGSFVENQNSQYLNIEVQSSQTNNADTYYAWQLVNIADTNLGDDGGLISNPDSEIASVDYRDLNNDDLVFVDGNSLNNGTVRDSIPGDLVSELTNQSQLDDFGSNAAIKLVAISKELYHYLESNEQQAQLEATHTHHTPQHYSNVINGVGIFAGYKEVYIQL